MIFLMFWAAAASKHWHLTLTRVLKRAYRWPKSCLASAKDRSTVSFLRL